MSKLNLVTIDIETFYSPDYSLSKKPWTTQSYILSDQFKVHGGGIKINGAPSKWWSAKQNRFAAAIAALKAKQTQGTKIALIGHNLQFDGSILAWRYGFVPDLYIDTLGLSRALIGQHSIKHGLHAIAPLVAQHEGHPLHKMDGLAQAMGIYDLPDWREQILADYTVKPAHFNPKTGLWEAGDAELTWAIFQRLAPHFPKKEFKALDWTIRKFTQPKLILDDDMLRDYLVFVKEQKQEALRNAGLDSRDALMSNPKYAAVLEGLGVVPPTKVNAKGKVTFAFAKTDEAHKALLEHDNPDVQAIVAARLAVKTTIEETRTEAYLEASTLGPWPVAYNYAGAVNTQRDSGNKGGGGNPMNLKRKGVLRNAILAPEGYTLLVFDLSQIECRLALWYGSLHPKSTGAELDALEVMRRGDELKRQGSPLTMESCIYSHFAGMMYGRYVDPAKDKNERQGGKSAVLGLGFGMGAARFIDYNLTLGNRIEAAFADSTVHLYRNTYVGVKNMWWSLERAFKDAVNACNIPGRSDNYSDTFRQFGPAVICRDPLFGSVGIRVGNDNLMVKYPDLSWDAEDQATYREGPAKSDRDSEKRVSIFGGKFYENLIQHDARHILTEKKIAINERYEVVKSTYDEVVVLVPLAEINEAIGFCNEIMTAPHELHPGLPIGVEYGYHRRYGKAKD